MAGFLGFDFFCQQISVFMMDIGFQEEMKIRERSEERGRKGGKRAGMGERRKGVKQNLKN